MFDNRKGVANHIATLVSLLRYSCEILYELTWTSKVTFLHVHLVDTLDLRLERCPRPICLTRECKPDDTMSQTSGRMRGGSVVTNNCVTSSDANTQLRGAVWLRGHRGLSFRQLYSSISKWISVEGNEDN